jgi:hypothetical protein
MDNENAEGKGPASPTAEEFDGAHQPHLSATAEAEHDSAPAAATDTPTASPVSAGAATEGEAPAPPEVSSSEVVEELTAHPPLPHDAVDTAPMTEAFESARQVPKLVESEVDRMLRAARAFHTLLSRYDPGHLFLEVEQIPSWVKEIVGRVIVEIKDLDRATIRELHDAYDRHYKVVSDRDRGSA